MKTLKIIVGLFLTICVSNVYSQKTLNVLDLYSDSHLPRKARIIEAKATVGTLDYHASIGGVSFEETAKPASALEGKKIALDFNNSKFTVEIDENRYEPNLPDWILVPVTEFVNSGYNVAFSSLGDTATAKQAQCLYHPAFLNTLAGLRLFQADLLNIPGVLWDLPIDRNGKYLLANSEKNLTPQKDSILNERLYDELCGEGRPFTTFSLTDKNTDFTFALDNGKFSIAGHPYYFFTKNIIDEKVTSQLQDKLDLDYNVLEENAKIFLGADYSDDLNPRVNLAGLRQKLSELKGRAQFNPFPYYKIQKTLADIDSLNNLHNNDVGIRFVALDDYTLRFKNNWEMLKRYNPALYSSLEEIARWSAFFRYVKKNNPENWDDFVKKARKRTVKDAPKVETPDFFEIDYIRIFTDRVKKQQIY